jgi:peptidoglycan/LPS O-acetylase OafA/YrhL
MWFAVTWSLAVEEQFYLFVPLLVRWLAERRLMAGLIGVVCVAPVIRVLVFHCLEPDAARVLLPCRADALAIGALLAAGWRKDWFQEYVKEHARLLQGGVVLLAAGVAAMLPALIGGTNLVQATIGYSWMALLHGGMLLLVLSRPGNWLGAAMRWKWLRSLGTVSYCVYLIHLAFLIFAHYLIRGRSPRLESWGDAGVSALALGATLGVATISWRWLEKPLIRRGHSYSYREGS